MNTIISKNDTTSDEDIDHFVNLVNLVNQCKWVETLEALRYMISEKKKNHDQHHAGAGAGVLLSTSSSRKGPAPRGRKGKGDQETGFNLIWHAIRHSVWIQRNPPPLELIQALLDLNPNYATMRHDSQEYENRCRRREKLQVRRQHGRQGRQEGYHRHPIVNHYQTPRRTVHQAANHAAYYNQPLHLLCSLFNTISNNYNHGHQQQHQQYQKHQQHQQQQHQQHIQNIIIMLVKTNSKSLLQKSCHIYQSLPLHVLLQPFIGISDRTNSGEPSLLPSLLLFNVFNRINNNNDKGDDDDDDDGNRDGNSNNSNYNSHLCCSSTLLGQIVSIQPQSLLIPNKGGITCLEIFWNAFCIKQYQHHHHHHQCQHGIDHGVEVLPKGGQSKCSNCNNCNNCSSSSRSSSSRSSSSSMYRLCPRTAMFMYDSRNSKNGWGNYFHDNDGDNDGSGCEENQHCMELTTKVQYTLIVYRWVMYLMKQAYGAAFSLERKEGKDYENKRERTVSSFSPVHAITQLSSFVPMDMIEFIFQAHSSDVQKIDIYGNTSLHLAIGMIGAIEKRRSVYMSASTIIQRQEKLMHIIKQLVQYDATLASIPNKQGYHPFFLALKYELYYYCMDDNHRHNSCDEEEHPIDNILNVLLDAYPDVIHTVDPIHGLNPLLFGAMTQETPLSHNAREEDQMLNVLCVDDFYESCNSINVILDDENENKKQRGKQQLMTLYHLLRRYQHLV